MDRNRAEDEHEDAVDAEGRRCACAEGADRDPRRHSEITHRGGQQDGSAPGPRDAGPEQPSQPGRASQIEQQGGHHSGVADLQMQLAGDLPEQNQQADQADNPQRSLLAPAQRIESAGRGAGQQGEGHDQSQGGQQAELRGGRVRAQKTEDRPGEQDRDRCGTDEQPGGQGSLAPSQAGQRDRGDLGGGDTGGEHAVAQHQAGDQAAGQPGERGQGHRGDGQHDHQAPGRRPDPGDVGERHR